jgi:asparagine synthase (glutamine-hydrolysing)
MCQLAGVEVVYPLLDDEVVDFSLRVPSSLKLKGQRLRWFYKQAMGDFLPESILSKSKHGFGLPFGVWTQTEPELQAIAYDSISDLNGRQYFRSDFLEKAVDMHRTGHAAYYGELIWILMMLEQWFQAHSDS